MTTKAKPFARKNRAQAIKKALVGSNGKLGLGAKIFLYVMLTSLGFVYIYPILHMGVTSLKSLTDLLDPSVQWLPHQLSLDNYQKALEVMGFREHLMDTLLVRCWYPSCPACSKPFPAPWRDMPSPDSASRERISGWLACCSPSLCLSRCSWCPPTPCIPITAS